MARLSVLAFFGLIATTSLVAQEPKLRRTLVSNDKVIVRSLAFSPDGKTLASAGQFGTFNLWNIPTGSQTAAIKGHSADVLSVAFSPDGATIASGSEDMTTRLWSVTTHKNIFTINSRPDAVVCVAFSPDGKILARALRSMVSTKIDTKEEIRLWDVIAKKDSNILIGPRGSVTSVAFSPNGKALASQGRDGTIKLWDMTTCKISACLERNSPADSPLAYSPSGNTIAWGNRGGTIELWDVVLNKQTTVKGHTETIFSVVFGSDAKTLAFGGGKVSELGVIGLWDVTTEESTATLKEVKPVSCVAFSPDGTTLASGSWDGTIKLWDVQPKGSDNFQVKKDRKAASPSTEKEIKIEARFTAKVKWIELEGEREVEVVPAGVDPHWLMGIEILSVETPIKPLDTKGDIVLLIHSPAMLFYGLDDEAPGKIYSFTVSGTMRGGHPDFYHIEAKEKSADKSP